MTMDEVFPYRLLAFALPFVWPTALMIRLHPHALADYPRISDLQIKDKMIKSHPDSS